MVENFEEAFAAFCDVSMRLRSAAAQMRYASRSWHPGFSPAMCLTVPNTFIATTEAISQAGALPEFVDIDERTYNMSAETLQQYPRRSSVRRQIGRLVSRRSSRHVTALVPVHLYGQMADMDAIRS